MVPVTSGVRLLGLLFRVMRSIAGVAFLELAKQLGGRAGVSQARRPRVRPLEAPGFRDATLFLETASGRRR